MYTCVSAIFNGSIIIIDPRRSSRFHNFTYTNVISALDKYIIWKHCAAAVAVDFNRTISATSFWHPACAPLRSWLPTALTVSLLFYLVYFIFFVFFFRRSLLLLLLLYLKLKVLFLHCNSVTRYHLGASRNCKI